jgi:glycerophosphoryl diester phosphodiesterase
MLRREFLLGVAGAAMCPAIGQGFILIAHRGGVVGIDRPENSAAAIAGAIEHGYWMVEVDVRRTKDGEPILHHDRNLNGIYGDPRRPEEMTWAELKTLKAKANGAHPVHFEEACAMCGGKMRFMLDVKESDWPKEFYQRIVRYMDAAKVPGPIYSLGGLRVKDLFDGRVMVSAPRTELRVRADRGEPVAKELFVFELANEVDAAGLALCKELKVVYVAAINTFRYTMAKRDEVKGPEEDARRLRELGIHYYQIDSRYESLFDA